MKMVEYDQVDPLGAFFTFRPTLQDCSANNRREGV
jgi:hypothetical protein